MRAKRMVPFHPLPAVLLLTLILSVGSGCAGRGSADDNPERAFNPTVNMGAYALEGPDLAVIADLAGTRLEGTAQRNLMVGKGTMKLYAKDAENKLMCESEVKAQPTPKGRIRGVLDCTDGTIILFTLRNLGPDQGIGIGTSHEGNQDLTLFYHSSADEADRRFPQILEDFTQLRQEKRSANET